MIRTVAIFKASSIVAFAMLICVMLLLISSSSGNENSSMHDGNSSSRYSLISSAMFGSAKRISSTMSRLLYS